MVLPALVVLALVAVVAIASTGSTPGGSNETRPPSESLLDAFFTLWFLAVLVGGGLILYALTQRRASGGEVPRIGMVSTLLVLVLFTGVAYWRLRNWERPAPAEEDGESAFPRTTPISTTPEPEAPAPYEPSVSWLPIAIVLGLAVAAIVAYVVSERRARRGRRSGEALAEQLAVVFDDTLDDLRAEADPRRAIIAAYARLERVLAANGVPRRPAETSDEYLPRVLHDVALDARAVERLTALFKRAKFSQHNVDTAMKEEAIDALEQVRDALRIDRESPPPAPAVAALEPSS